MMTPTTAAVILSLLASSALAGPLTLQSRQSTTCNTKPSGASSAAPIASPSVSTAEACQQQCEANSQCQSFVFGLPSGASSPKCMLFAVEGAQVPSQDSNLMVFDKGCSGVPTGTPTASNPVGDNNSNTSGNGQQQQSNGGQRKGISKRQGGQNPAGNNNNGNTNAGAGNNNGNTNTGSNGNANTGSTGSTSRVCGTAPSGSSSNNATPMKTDTSITSQDACLQLCQNTSGCQSMEFGKESSGGSNECRLFSVAASQLPPNGSGATFVASDVGC